MSPTIPLLHGLPTPARPLRVAVVTRELKVAVGRLAHNRAVREPMAAAARPSVAHRTWGSVNTELVEHYRSVTAPSHQLAGSVPHTLRT